MSPSPTCQINVPLSLEFMRALEAWREKQDVYISRAGAIRSMMARQMRADGIEIERDNGPDGYGPLRKTTPTV